MALTAAQKATLKTYMEASPVWIGNSELAKEEEQGVNLSAKFSEPQYDDPNSKAMSNKWGDN